MTPRIISIGLSRWKAHNLRPILARMAQSVHYVANAASAARLSPHADDWLLFWGATPPRGVELLSHTTGAVMVRLEDGFIRSVGLGSDLIPPMSLVFDKSGIYFDATRPSDLEDILATSELPPELLARAALVRHFIVANGLTKYNLEPRHFPQWLSDGRKVVLVPGQVETDASIALGGHAIRTNAQLLAAARAAEPEAFLVYKPHPDVMSGNRRGRLVASQALAIADHVETGASIVSCIDACDEVHTITSLSGFDALLRDKPVTTYGVPFYAGWGLTVDRAKGAPALERRRRKLSLDQLVAGALLQYPCYWNPDQSAFSDCETVLHGIKRLRNALETEGKLEQMRSGFTQRQARKLKTLASAWLGGRAT
jgi:capsular polysaccharide export protein